MQLNKHSAGFTLIEMIIGIVVLAIALVVITGALGPLYKRSSDPWHQVRAAELGQSFLNEIMARAFDEASDKAGGEFRCDAHVGVEPEPGATACNNSLLLSNAPVLACSEQLSCEDTGGCSAWREEAERASYDDVDDFHAYVGTGADIANVLGSGDPDAALASYYQSYKVCVDVRYAGNELPGISSTRKAKKVTVSIVTPSGEEVNFSAYKGNW
jgi:MSHA pilin protein MshD